MVATGYDFGRVLSIVNLLDSGGDFQSLAELRAIAKLCTAMPNLEAPIELEESSPDTSVSQHEYHIPTLPPIRLLNTPPPAPTPVSRGTARIAARPNQQATATFDRDLPILEEDNHWPARPYLLPVVLPPVNEPTLDELLRRVTERDDLHNVESVRLRVISFNVSLSSLSLFLPRLQHLNLSGSVLSSLRDLGCGLAQLLHLNVSNCGLNSFDGTGGLPSVQTLIADGNMIQRVGPLAELSQLRSLSAKNNRISELSLLSFLGMCSNLIEVQLQGNPVCHLPLYRTNLQRNVPSLELLDGVPLTTNTVITIEQQQQQLLQQQQQQRYDGEHSTTGSELSSLSSEIYSDSDKASLTTSTNDSMDSTAPHSRAVRPATAPTESVITQRSVQLCRPSSVSEGDRLRRNSSSLSMSTPISGSVLNWTRRQRLQERERALFRRRNAWPSTTSSSSDSEQGHISK